ncbi:ABC1 kinase family protein [Aquirufa sp. ROCK-SH2]
MKENTYIPVTKVARASKFVGTGLKVGGNYLKYSIQKMANPDLNKDQLHEDNAKDIYDSLSVLKGSALKVTQMLSMDRGMLPRAYREAFAMAQYSAPPLSGPLVVKTFQTELGKSPGLLFDQFDLKASFAASIGQVHRAEKDGKKLAVKVQYPGVANSIHADLKMIKPIALAMFSLNEKDVDRYMAEVQDKLMEETNYVQEMKYAQDITAACSHLDGLVFPNYYPEYSSNKILCMDWLEGMHLKEFLATNPSQEIRDLIGQRLWDFYEFQIHQLKMVHADPHPGNFLLHADGSLGILDFGCVKKIPSSFYDPYFALLDTRVLKEKSKTMEIFEQLEFVNPLDSAKEKEDYFELFTSMIELLARPFQTSQFDFSDVNYVNEIYQMADELKNNEMLRYSKHARGSQHGLYINRTYFGLYTLLHELGSKIVIG